ncbi:hypothetical protein DAEQUDRAFT_813711 [Daedalea quercina L-15889]|uniref:C2H2-type domain-containing protein n=1 Tax=Daedalea quercina L-15889 TaxID=1314783 RepID=A0A165MY48_9APHY|nr:hypothetical protein DAEQUDRAFT_813711 [Daedalea quercina L-15889]
MVDPSTRIPDSVESSDQRQMDSVRRTKGGSKASLDVTAQGLLCDESQPQHAGKFSFSIGESQREDPSEAVVADGHAPHGGVPCAVPLDLDEMEQSAIAALMQLRASSRSVTPYVDDGLSDAAPHVNEPRASTPLAVTASGVADSEESSTEDEDAYTSLDNSDSDSDWEPEDAAQVDDDESSDDGGQTLRYSKPSLKNNTDNATRLADTDVKAHDSDTKGALPCSLRICIPPRYKRRGPKVTMAKGRPYACSFTGCAWTFTTRADWQRHERMHSGKHVWKCGVCDKILSRRDAVLRHHHRQHPDEEPSPKYVGVESN